MKLKIISPCYIDEVEYEAGAVLENIERATALRAVEANIGVIIDDVNDADETTDNFISKEGVIDAVSGDGGDKTISPNRSRGRRAVTPPADDER